MPATITKGDVMTAQLKSFSASRTVKRLMANPTFRAVARCAVMCAFRAAYQGGQRVSHGCDAEP